MSIRPCRTLCRASLLTITKKPRAAGTTFSNRTLQPPRHNATGSSKVCYIDRAVDLGSPGPPNFPEEDHKHPTRARNNHC